MVHLHFQPLLAADEHGAGLCTLVGADNALLLHLVHDAGGAGVAQLAAALQKAGGGLPGVDDHIHGLLEHGVGACVLLGVGTAAALFAVLNGVLFHGFDHGLVVLDGGALLDEVQHAADLLIPHEGALDTGGLGCAHGHKEHIALTQQLFCTGTLQNGAAVYLTGHRKGDAAGDVGLDKAGDDVHAGALGRNDQVDAGSAGYLFRANYSEQKFAGYTAVYEEAKDEETSEVRRPLPSLKQGDAVELKNVTKEQQFTQPPARYTEATLIRAMEEKGIGHEKGNYKLRDWVFSRQRYWGEPIPLVHCDKCGWVPLPEEQLPLLLPEVDSYEVTDTGESPLSKMTDWVNTTCPCCGGPAKRETDTMPQWAGSSWYYLRYMDPHDKNAPVSKEAETYWGPVDWYNGGMEHTTLHLLYSRFWHKFLYDIGVVHTKEPYAKRTSHGMILGQNPHYVGNVSTEEEKQALIEKYGNQALRPAVKMSKSLGNVVNPDDVVNEYGADTLRLYEMFIGDFEKAAPWNTSSIKGCKRFLDKIWSMSEKLVPGEGVRPELEAVANRTIKKVGEDIDALKANTAIAQLMIYVNALSDQGGATKAEYELLLQLLNPFAPHMTEELWQQLGHTEQLAYHAWPTYDEAKCVEQTIEIAVQVNGKVKARIKVPAAIENADAIAAAKAEPAVAEAIAGKTIAKEIYVKGKLVNIAVKG